MLSRFDSGQSTSSDRRSAIDDRRFGECARREGRNHLAHVGVLAEDRPVEWGADDRVLQSHFRAFDNRLGDRDPTLHLEIPRLCGIDTRRRRVPAVPEEACPRERLLDVVEIGLAQLQVRAGLRELGANVRVLEPRDHLALVHPVPFDHAQIHEARFPSTPRTRGAAP